MSEIYEAESHADIVMAVRELPDEEFECALWPRPLFLNLIASRKLLKIVNIQPSLVLFSLFANHING